MFGMDVFKTIWTGKLSISSTVIFMSSILIRFLAMGCIALAFYIKYGDDILNKTQLLALDSIELHGIPLGSFIQGLVFSSVMVFFIEIIYGILGIYACLKKKKLLLYVYICLCVGAICVYIVHIVLWGLLYDGVGSGSDTSNSSVSNSFYIYYRRYQDDKLIPHYETIWRDFYTNFSCCGGSGESSCTINVGTYPGCYDRFSAKMTIYMQAYIGLFCIFIVCQVVSIAVTDYSIIKLLIKEKQKHVSTQTKNLLCLKSYGICPTFLVSVKSLWNRAPSCLLSVINKCVNLIVMLALVLTSIYFLTTGLVSNIHFIHYFRQIHFYNYNFHDLMAGFGSGFLAIGGLSIGNNIIGLIASKRQSVILHTLSFFLSCMLIVIKLICIIFWAVIFDQVTSLITTRLNLLIDSSSDSALREFRNRLMINFRCCEFTSTNTNFRNFCYSDIHESIVDMGQTIYSSIGVHGTFNGYKKCGTAICDKLRLPAICFFVFVSIGIICDVLGLILISKEFKASRQQPSSPTKEFKESRQEPKPSSPTTDKKLHLIPWLFKTIMENKPRGILVTMYLISTTFMTMVELSFIVLASIFSISYHINRDYIDSIGDVYKFLAIAGVVLVTCNMVIRIICLAAVFNFFEKTLFVSTAVMIIVGLLNLAYVIMASVLRNDEYPCTYTDAAYVSHDCSSQFEATSGVAIGVFVIEFVMMVVLAVIIHDRSYYYWEVKISSHNTDTKETRGIYKTLYIFLFVEREIFNKGPKLVTPFVVYFVSSIVVTLLEVTFIVLVCFYGLSWHNDRSWITSGLYNIYEPTINLGELFDFLAKGSLVLIPIASINRIIGIIAVIKTHKIFLIVNTIGLIVTTLVTFLFVVLSSFLIGYLYKCEIVINAFTRESCPYHKFAIVGVALATFIMEFIMQIGSFVVNDRSYAFFPPYLEETAEVDEKETIIRQGMFTSLYDVIFKRRTPFRNASKLSLAVVIYIISSVFMLMLEITFVVVVPIYGISWVMDRSWVNTGLYDILEGTLNLGLTYDFIAIAFLVLIPLIVINRYVGILAIYKRWHKINYVNSGVVMVTILLTILFIVLSSIVLGLKYRCNYNNQDCPPQMKTFIGVAIAMLILELYMQILCFVINNQSHGHIMSSDVEEEDKIKQGMLSYLYDKIFKKRKPFRNAAKLSVAVVVYLIFSAAMLMLEITMVVLIPIYGISWVMDRTWITSGLYNTLEGTLNLGLSFDFISIALLVLIPLIVVNRYLGITAINKRWKIVNYVTYGIVLFTTLLTILFIVLSSITLGLKYKCSYIQSGIIAEQDCPTRMKIIIGVVIAFLILEFLMQIFSFIIHDRGFQYFPLEKDESEEGLIVKDMGKGMFLTIYDKLFRRREPFTSAPKLEFFIAFYVVCALLFLMIEITYIVLVPIYGLSWVMDRSWITQGLHELYNSSMNLGVLFDFLAICSLVLIPVISISRFVGIIAMSTKHKFILYVNLVVLFVTVLVTIIYMTLASVLLYAEYRCRYYDSSSLSYQNCPRMNYIVGVGVAMFIAELLMQIMSFIVYDRSYKYIQSDTTEGGLFRKIIHKFILERNIITQFNQIKIPTLLIGIGSVAWLVIEVLFWIGTIIEMGSPRLMNGTLMSILYTQSRDDINLGHLADGIAYTAIGLIPIVVLMRVGGLVVMMKQNSTLLLTAAITSVILGLGCATLFGLSTYHIQYVYSCFGSSSPTCEEKVMDILLTTASVFLTFFLVETIIHIIQSCFFFYVVGIFKNVSVKTLHLFQEQELSARVVKIVHIVVRLLEMVISFMMLISMTFWLSGVHIHSDKSSLSSRSFYDTDLLRLANGLVITSIVTITIVLINNIVGIVSVINGMLKTLTANTVIVGVCLVTECVSLGFQSKIEWHIYDRAISIYISYTVFQIVCQIFYIVLSVFDIKSKVVTNKVHDSRLNLTTDRTFTPGRRTKNVLETSLRSEIEVENA